MALEDIIEKIRQEAQKKASVLEKETRQAADKIERAAEREAEAARRRIRELVRARAEEEARAKISRANLDARMEILAEKQKLLDEVFAETEKRLAALERGEYQRLLKALLRRSAETGDEEILVEAGERGRFTPEFLAEINRELAEAGKKGDLRLGGFSEAAPARKNLLRGGFLLRGKRTEVDNSLPAIVKTFRPELEQEAARILFGDREATG